MEILGIEEALLLVFANVLLAAGWKVALSVFLVLVALYLVKHFYDKHQDNKALNTVKVVCDSLLNNLCSDVKKLTSTIEEHFRKE